MVTGAVMFAGVGVLAAQLAATRRQANGIAAAIFGASLLIRVVADSRPGRHWLRWLSPLGWAENLHPLTSPAPVMSCPSRHSPQPWQPRLYSWQGAVTWALACCLPVTPRGRTPACSTDQPAWQSGSAAR